MSSNISKQLLKPLSLSPLCLFLNIWSYKHSIAALLPSALPSACPCLLSCPPPQSRTFLLEGILFPFTLWHNVHLSFEAVSLPETSVWSLNSGIWGRFICGLLPVPSSSPKVINTLQCLLKRKTFPHSRRQVSTGCPICADRYILPRRKTSDYFKR